MNKKKPLSSHNVVTALLMDDNLETDFQNYLDEQCKGQTQPVDKPWMFVIYEKKHLYMMVVDPREKQVLVYDSAVTNSRHSISIDMQNRAYKLAAKVRKATGLKTPFCMQGSTAKSVYYGPRANTLSTSQKNKG
jgi:hypothetical protein